MARIFLAFSKTGVSISALSHKTVHGYSVCSFQFDRPSINLDWPWHNSFIGFLGTIPDKLDSRKGRIPPSQVWVHRNRIFKACEDPRTFDFFDNDDIFNNIRQNPKGDWPRRKNHIRSKIARIHEGAVSLSFMAIDRNQKLQKKSLLFPNRLKPQINCISWVESNFFLPLCKLTVDTMYILVQLRIWDNLHFFMVHLHKGNPSRYLLIL